MRQVETVRISLPVPTGAGTGFSPYRGPSKPAFLSQLIAERHHLATQRVKRRAPVAEVLRTYDAGGRLSVRRMPPGYRLDTLA
ncbi:MAG TPA: hypothetical protein VHA07_05970 [Devosia sp.]|nr:hypothetical protein [Devosia sp.]